MENQEVKKTKAELVEAMKRLFIEIDSITEEIDSLKEDAKERGMPAEIDEALLKLETLSN